MPKLSIITINLNNLLGLKKTMESVFAQTFTDYEYIIIDGGSTDGSNEYIEQHQDKLIYWVSERDNGGYQAMNKGIVKAKGDYLMFLNSGDYLFKNDTLFTAFKSMQGNDADVYFGNIIIEVEKGKPVSRRYKEITLNFWRNETINHQASFIRASLFMDFGLYNLNYSIAADYAFFLKVFINGRQFKYINEDLVYYCLEGNSSQNMDKYILQMKEAWQETVPGFIETLRSENVEYKELMKFKIMKVAHRLNSKYQDLKRNIKNR